MLARRRPDLVSGVVMLGCPQRDPLAVHPVVRANIEAVAAIGRLGVPGFFSRVCLDGDCCATFWEQFEADVPRGVGYVSVYSKTDGIVVVEGLPGPGRRAGRGAFQPHRHGGAPGRLPGDRRLAGRLPPPRRAPQAASQGRDGHARSAAPPSSARTPAVPSTASGTIPACRGQGTSLRWGSAWRGPCTGAGGGSRTPRASAWSRWPRTCASVRWTCAARLTPRAMAASWSRPTGGLPTR